ncbi:MAG: hypothetical protein DWQ31_06655 [Planctomycetota bacterium]|nr:MAG: hypothetical protein DWQ31_06655 [Planctomycetota bacterium]REJ90344.1 MAG: hypothetical protein DWQ35_16850 [Planctomycetota bacterium]
MQEWAARRLGKELPPANRYTKLQKYVGIPGLWICTPLLAWDMYRANWLDIVTPTSRDGLLVGLAIFVVIILVNAYKALHATSLAIEWKLLDAPEEPF